VRYEPGFAAPPPVAAAPPLQSAAQPSSFRSSLLKKPLDAALGSAPPSPRFR
jgi:hypothetical protein